jgi:predicted methyltransferase
MLVSRFGRSVVAFGLGLFVAQASAAPMSIAEALADPARPAEQRAVDGVRKPAEILALASVKAGDRVADVGPGSGYYTRLFSRVVGESGKVYAFNPDWVIKMFPKAGDLADGLVKAGYANVEARSQPMAEIAFDAPLDVLFISQLYHDEHWPKVDIAQMNAAIFRALKPGGVYMVIDHVAPAGTTDAQIDKLHRIDPGFARAEIEKAGFKFDSELRAWRQAADPHTDNVFAPAIRGKTDQFAYRFRKPR